VLAGTGIPEEFRRNLEESGGIRRNCKSNAGIYRNWVNSCKHGRKPKFSYPCQKEVPVKNSSGKNKNPKES
jgi:hypothetical protein